VPKSKTKAPQKDKSAINVNVKERKQEKRDSKGIRSMSVTKTARKGGGRTTKEERFLHVTVNAVRR